MKGQIADMLSSMSVAPPDRTVRAGRTTDSQSSSGSQKGFSSVLQKLRETRGQDDRRRDDDVSLTKKTDERAQEKGTKTKDYSEARTAQSDSSMKRTESRLQIKDTKPNKESASFRTEDDDASSVQTVETGRSQYDESRPVDTSMRGGEYSGKDNRADSVSSAQTQAFQIWTALMGPLTDTTLPPQEAASNEGELQSSDGEDQPANPPSEPASASSKTSNSWGLTVQDSEPTLSQDGAAVSAKAQPQQPLTTAVAHTEHEARGGGGVTHDTPPVTDEANVQKAKVSQDAGLIPSKIAADSSGLTQDGLLQKDSRLSLGSVIKNSQAESPMLGSDHGASEARVERPSPVHVDGHPSLPEHHESGDMKVKPVLPQGHQPTLDFVEQFGERWLGQHDQRSGQAELRTPQTALTDLQAQQGKLPDTLVAGAFGSVNHNIQPTLSSVSSPVAQAQPGLSTHQVADQPMPAMMRTVVLSVAQPDLGQVNVRVAMTNDIVHTHLSTDRPEVGQFLLNGQDRLQSSLQMNGFDMGQFRVDIDRQGAGRSFQQGFSQEQQGRTWNQETPWMEGERVTHPYDDARASMHRRLNVVA